MCSVSDDNTQGDDALHLKPRPAPKLMAKCVTSIAFTSAVVLNHVLFEREDHSSPVRPSKRVDLPILDTAPWGSVMV